MMLSVTFLTRIQTEALTNRENKNEIYCSSALVATDLDSRPRSTTADDRYECDHRFVNCQPSHQPRKPLRQNTRAVCLVITTR